MKLFCTYADCLLVLSSVFLELTLSYIDPISSLSASYLDPIETLSRDYLQFILNLLLFYICNSGGGDPPYGLGRLPSPYGGSPSPPESLFKTSNQCLTMVRLFLGGVGGTVNKTDRPIARRSAFRSAFRSRSRSRSRSALPRFLKTYKNQ